MDTQLAPVMLVCRLDGPTASSVQSMIDGAIAAERTGLTGFAYVDLRGITEGAFALGDKWLATAAVELRQYGMPVVWDSSPTLFPADYPMGHVAMYLGWYAGTVEGPMARDDFRFVPGAIAVHIHSFSAATLRDAHSGWAGPLVAHGAAATLGNVYEPYLMLTPNLDVFTDRLRNGFNFAESAYASVSVLSWMTTFVGDPLYRPFQDARCLRGYRRETGDRVRGVQQGGAYLVREGRAAGGRNNWLQARVNYRAGLCGRAWACCNGPSRIITRRSTPFVRLRNAMGRRRMPCGPCCTGWRS